MNRIMRGLLWLGASLWALLTFAASNTPEDVAESANGWLSLPIVNALPAKLLAFVSSPIAFSLTFFVLGALAFWRINKWREARAAMPWNKVLADEMRNVNWLIDACGMSSNLHSINADIDVLRVKTKKHDLAFPDRESGFSDVRQLEPYLTRVSAHLSAGQLKQAQSAAAAFSEKPLPVEPRQGYLGGY